MHEPAPATIMTERVADLLRRARSPYTGERDEVERAFRELGPGGVEALIALLRSKTRKWHRRRRAYFWLLGAFLCIGVPAMIYLLSGAIIASLNGDIRLASARLGGALGGILGGAGGGFLGGFAWLLVPPPELMTAATLLVQVDDLRAIGPLARIMDMRWTSPEIRYAVGKALARLLPRIDSDCGTFMNPEDRAVLSHCLLHSQPEKEEELVLGILHAISWIGDAENLRALRAFEKKITETPPALRLAAEFSYERKILGLHYQKRRPIADRMDERHAITQPPTPTLRDATRGAVARLESRLEALARSDMLLRAADNSEQAADTLLRPTGGVGPDDPAILLRAGQSPDSAPSS